MYQTQKTYIHPKLKIVDLINENPILLLMLEHFNIDFAVADKSVDDLCKENNISASVFILISNLYNGFFPEKVKISLKDDILVIISFLKNSHNFYKYNKYPEIKDYIQQLHEKYQNDDIAMIEKFFSEYFKEVLEHLEYEDKIAFPYFSSLIESQTSQVESEFSVNEYREHHGDIETKLTDLKNLLLKHIELKDNLPIRRKFLNSLFELEYDLNIHSLIEEKILLPLIDKVEKKAG